jgi:methionine salvage enolase-phosphatase E1
MAENDPTEPTEPKTYTEQEYKEGISSAVKKRLARYSDYDDLKRQVGELTEKLQGQSDYDDLKAFKAQAVKDGEHRKLVEKVADELGIDPRKVGNLRGDDYESLKAAAKETFSVNQPVREGNPSKPMRDDGVHELVRSLFPKN